MSTLDQNGLRQLDAMALEGISTDKASGRDAARQQLTELLRFARGGDTVVVHGLDTLARKIDGLCR